ncbi:PDZ domain-containing protein [Sphingomonas piscis]|uniref:PDZ domain-containing protein n=1 Tax=Sphingomonas piscis TaxID=2714943 RepID=A0A6G7YTK1_9SPHN|nr:PDZ domain-containing protein [Sphingomonas piscis]
MRYAYGVTMALLAGGTALSIATGPVGAQVAQNAPAAMPPNGAPQSFADLAARLQPAVVNISTKQRVPVRSQSDPFAEMMRRFGLPGTPQGQDDGDGTPQGGQGQGGQGRTRETGSLGSGFIISPDGYIVTNNHLIQSQTGNGTVDEVVVTLTNRKEYPARIVGRDQASDLALLKIDGANLPYVNWGDSTRARVGDWVLAIGNPYGLGGTVTAGIISALHRNITGGGAYDRYIQTDASINMGNSGGPMFDLNGNVIGVNSALISPTGASVGIGLSIPAEAARPVIDSLRRGQRPQRGYLGVGLQPLDENLAEAFGLPKDRGEVVRSVVPGEPAAKAGLQQGDVIVRVNGQEVNPEQSASYLISNIPVGSRVPIDILRDRKPQRVTVTVGLRPTDEQLARLLGDDSGSVTPETPATPTPQTLGLSLAPANPALLSRYKLPSGSTGVVITGVDPNSVAGEEALREGDLIVAIGNRRVTSPAQVVEAIAAARRAGAPRIALLVKRGSGPEAFATLDLRPQR